MYKSSRIEGCERHGLVLARALHTQPELAHIFMHGKSDAVRHYGLQVLDMCVKHAWVTYSVDQRLVRSISRRIREL